MPETYPRPGAEGADRLERWWSEHSELDQLVEACEEALERRSEAAASAALEELGLALEDHFRIEEEVYFPAVQAIRPDLGSLLQSAKLAHRDLLDAVLRARDEVDLGTCDQAREALSLLLGAFRSHEELEGRVIAELARTSCE